MCSVHGRVCVGCRIRRTLADVGLSGRCLRLPALQPVSTHSRVALCTPPRFTCSSGPSGSQSAHCGSWRGRRRSQGTYKPQRRPPPSTSRGAQARGVGNAARARDGRPSLLGRRNWRGRCIYKADMRQLSGRGIARLGGLMCSELPGGAGGPEPQSGARIRNRRADLFGGATRRQHGLLFSSNGYRHVL